MLHNFVFLHISDLHMRKCDQRDIEIMTRALIKDVKKMVVETGQQVDCVFFTGDLVAQGENAIAGERQFELSYDSFIEPLLVALELEIGDFYVVPGNHEIDKTMIDTFQDDGLRRHLTSRSAVNELLDRAEVDFLARIAYFQHKISQFFHPEAKVLSRGLATVHIREKANWRIGISCLNSVWRGTGKSEQDRGQLIVGERQVYDAIQAMGGCDLRICLVHHPLDWLAPFDKHAIQRSMNDHDLVLHGHVHRLSNRQLIETNSSTMYCTCGALYKGRHDNNGYSFVVVNLITKDVDIYFRQYVDDRYEFDAGISVCEGGHAHYRLSPKSPHIAKGFEIVAQSSESILRDINDNLVSALIDEMAPVDLRSIFVPPILSRKSEYLKEEGQELVDFQSVIDEEENVIILGRRESGKTTALQYICCEYLLSYSRRLKVPFLVNAKDLAGKEPLERAMARFMADAGSTTISSAELRDMLMNGNCVLLIDDFDHANQKHIDRLKQFISSYPLVRVILAAEEDAFKTISAQNIDLDVGFAKFYIQSMNTAAVRSLVTKWVGSRLSADDLDQFVIRIMKCMFEVGLPRTPMTLSLVIATCAAQQNYRPINEASVLERFMEIILEKLSEPEAMFETYDFHVKEAYLAELAWYMAQRQVSMICYAEYMQFTANYCANKGFELSKCKFDRVFFTKGVLIRHGDYVEFRFRCMFEYYCAKMAVNDDSVLSALKDQFLIFDNELSLYSGISRRDPSLLRFLKDKLEAYLRNGEKLLEWLNSYRLDGIVIEAENVAEGLNKFKLNDQERDNILELPDNHDQTKRFDEPAQKESFFKLLRLYGRVVRNSELLDEVEKREGLLYAARGFCLLIAAFAYYLEEKVTYQKMIERQKEFSEKVTAEEFDKIKLAFKAALPIAAQNIATDTMGSQKLTISMKNLLMQNETDEWMRFIVGLTYSDMKLSGYLDILGTLVNKTKNKAILRLIYLKLWYYYTTGHVRKSEEEQLEAIIADIVVRLQKKGKFAKSIVMKMIREKKGDKLPSAI